MDAAISSSLPGLPAGKPLPESGSSLLLLSFDSPAVISEGKLAHPIQSLVLRLAKRVLMTYIPGAIALTLTLVPTMVLAKLRVTWFAAALLAA